MEPLPLAGQLDPALAVQVQAGFVKLGGNVSCTTAPTTPWGPELETATVYVRGSPQRADTPPSLLSTARSAAGAAVTVVGSVSVLLPGTGSLSAALTDAVLLRFPARGGASTTIVMTGAAPTARLGRVHVTTPAASPHAQPVPPALWKTTPAGSVSATETAEAGAGPALATTSV